MVPETNDLEQELQRNLKLRHELGGEIRLGVLMANAAEGEPAYRREAPKAEGTLSNRLIKTAWITVGVIGLMMGALIAIWSS